MNTPSIAHFGTTIIEAPPPAGVSQQDASKEGALGDMLHFLEILGFAPAMENFYPGIGRQYIWGRGDIMDVDYVEQDNFTSYVAVTRPATTAPRAGDTIFRLTHAEPQAVLSQLLAEHLATPLSADELEDFLSGQSDWVLINAPNGQTYQFGRSSELRKDNHAVFIWTPSDRLKEVSRSYQETFGFQVKEQTQFHDVGEVLVLERETPAMTIGLLYRDDIEPRWSEDIFKEAGYAHFRLGAPDKNRAESASREAFPAAGDVSFVYFEDSYLELVQA